MLGEMTEPLPMPATNRAGAASQVADDSGAKRSSSAVALMPTITALSPHTVSSLPSRSTSRPDTTAAPAEPTAKGVTARPDRSGE